jgi:lipopolysaccharide export system protein LptA
MAARLTAAGWIVASLVLFFVSLGAKEPKTIITGDQMEILQGGQKLIFTGNSRVSRGESVLNADQMIQDKKNNRIEAAGKVNFRSYTQEREAVFGRSEKAIYSPESGQGELWGGRPKIIYNVKNSTGPIELEADRINFDQKKEDIFASGNVEIVSSSVSAYSPSAQFNQNEKQVVLTGQKPQPLIVYRGEDRKGKYRADRITMVMDSHTVVLEGNVSGVIELDTNNKGKP